ncbi:MAG: hypothetical protein Q9159_002581 [Coniocarpon cinnabarinum]
MNPPRPPTLPTAFRNFQRQTLHKVPNPHPHIDYKHDRDTAAQTEAREVLDNTEWDRIKDELWGYCDLHEIDKIYMVFPWRIVNYVARRLDGSYDELAIMQSLRCMGLVFFCTIVAQEIRSAKDQSNRQEEIKIFVQNADFTDDDVEVLQFWGITATRGDQLRTQIDTRTILIGHLHMPFAQSLERDVRHLALRSALVLHPSHLDEAGEDSQQHCQGSIQAGYNYCDKVDDVMTHEDSGSGVTRKPFTEWKYGNIKIWEGIHVAESRSTAELPSEDHTSSSYGG